MCCKGCGGCERKPTDWACLDDDELEFADGSDISDAELDAFLNGDPIEL